MEFGSDFGCHINADWPDFGDPGIILGPFWVPFKGPQAPEHASEGSLCPRGSLDPFWG